MVKARLLKVGKSQAVHIPARYRIDADEVEIFERNGDLILCLKARTAAALFERVRSRGSDYSDWKRPPQGKNRPVPSFD